MKGSLVYQNIQSWTNWSKLEKSNIQKKKFKVAEMFYLKKKFKVEKNAQNLTEIKKVAKISKIERYLY